MLVSMSMTETESQATGGSCFICGTSVEGDIMEHCATKHARTPTKPKVAIKSWKERLDSVVTAMGEIRQETDVDTQIRRLDVEVIQETYLIRANLARIKRTAAKEG
jgi:hypothetical protein